MLISTWGESVSFSGVAPHIISRLPEGLDYRVLALDLSSPVEDSRVIPCAVSSDERVNAFRVSGLLDELSPSIVVFYFDARVIRYYTAYLHGAQKRGAKIVAYVPIDGVLSGPDMVAPFEFFDAVVLFTAHQRSHFLQFVCGSPARRVLDIPHGVDASLFYEHEEGAARAVVVGSDELRDLGERSGSFLVLNGNREISRKRIDLTVHGFASFLAKHSPDAFLVLPRCRADGPSALLAKDLGISERVLIGGDSRYVRTVAELNNLYNQCDVGINSAMGEGWGLISFEHAAVGRAQVVPGSPHMKEIWADSALYAEIEATSDS